MLICLPAAVTEHQCPCLCWAGFLPASKGSVFDKIRAVLFFAWSMTLAVPLFISMTVMSPLVLWLDKYRSGSTVGMKSAATAQQQQHSIVVPQATGHLWPLLQQCGSHGTLSLRISCLLVLRRLAQHFVNNIWAKISTSIFYPVEASVALCQLQRGHSANH